MNDTAPIIRILRLMAETDDAAPVLLSAADRLEQLQAIADEAQHVMHTVTHGFREDIDFTRLRYLLGNPE